MKPSHLILFTAMATSAALAIPFQTSAQSNSPNIKSIS